MKKIIVAIFIIFLLSALYAVIKISAFASQPMAVEHDRVIEVQNGDSLHSVVANLYETNAFKCNFCARAYVYFSDAPAIFPGEYELKANMSFEDFFHRLKTRAVLQHKITLIEGWTLAQAVNALWANEKIMKTLESDDPKSILEQLEFLEDYKERPSAEGLFFPATYNFSKGTSDVDVLKMAHKKMQQVLEIEWQSKSSNLPYKDAYEALIMASIIEKETGTAAERDEIAGVFIRRLAMPMLLQTDPTVIYGMGKKYKGNIRRSDLLRPSAYNTYVIEGLPPTPIALPGRESIYAALHPKPGTSLYFVADGEGGHVFSDNLKQHNNAVRAYLKKMREKK